MATIRYFVPEDGDTEEHPNVFLAPRPRQTGQPPLLRDVRSSFPLPGRYHFRFKTSPVPSGEHYGKGNDVAVWMDCLDDDRPVPVWRNTVLAKITRVGPDDDDDDHVATNGHRAAVVPEPRAPSPPAPAPATESLLNVFDEAPAPASTRATPTSSTGSLLDMGAPPSAPAPASYDVFGASPPPVHPNDELLSMGMSPRRPPPVVPRASPDPRASTTPAHQYASAPAPPRPRPTTFDSFSEKNGPFGGLNWS